MKFPREVWPSANRQTNTFSSKRKLVYNKEQFNDFVRLHNGKMNCYTSVYDYEEYTDKNAVVSTVILDRVFLDFDAHHGETDAVTGAQLIDSEQIDKCLVDLKLVVKYLNENDYKHDISFSGRGFHVYVYGEPTRDIRRLTAFFNLVKEFTVNGTLDSSAISSRRLRRIRNTMNMKASYGDGCYYCIPIQWTSEINVEEILSYAKYPNGIPLPIAGSKLVKWPEVPPIEESEIEASVINVGNLPLPPCMHSAIMVENPTDEARAYLISWYKDLLTWCDPSVDFFKGQIEPSDESKSRMLNQIISEIKYLHETHNIWLDFDEKITRHRAKYVLDGNYYFASCNTLNGKGYCVGKCWRMN